ANATADTTTTTAAAAATAGGEVHAAAGGGRRDAPAHGGAERVELPRPGETPIGETRFDGRLGICPRAGPAHCRDRQPAAVAAAEEPWARHLADARDRAARQRHSPGANDRSARLRGKPGRSWYVGCKLQPVSSGLPCAGTRRAVLEAAGMSAA